MDWFLLSLLHSLLISSWLMDKANVFLRPLDHYLQGFGNYSPGPWRKFKTPYLPKIYERTPDVLRQYRTEVTALALDSLPSGTNILYMDRRSTPAFQLLFCQRLSALHGEAPVKTLPGECPMYAKKGYPCSCGTITYIGYDWHYDQEAESWDELMLGERCRVPNGFGSVLVVVLRAPSPQDRESPHPQPQILPRTVMHALSM
jgi:hypothetical protein